MTDPVRVHRYGTSCSWSGSTALGYDGFAREHRLETPGSDTVLELSADAAFGGDGARWNPEGLLVAAVSSCQMLAFLAVAARARIDVVAYRDDAEGTMPEGPDPAWVERIVLRPEITVRGEGPSDERIRRLVDLAHRECFIARSVRAEIRTEPTVRRV